MTAQSKSPTTVKGYLLVFFWLCVFTAIEVAISYIDMSRSFIAILLVGTSLIKALLVATFFMHLKFEGKLIYFLVLFPSAIAVMFLLLLFPDIVIGYWQ